MNTKTLTKFLCIVLALCISIISLTGCGKKDEESDGVSSTETTLKSSDGTDINAAASGFDKSKYSSYMDSEYLDTLANVEVEDKMQVQMTVKDYGTVTIELYPDIAPVTVRNFVYLVNKGFYDGLTFHRIVKNFMIQGGDPKGNGTGDSDNTIFGEFSSNGFQNNLSHTAGVISMGRSNDNNSASCQFFICDVDYTGLDGNYASFGKVIEGFDVITKIASCETNYICPVDNTLVCDATTPCSSCGYTMTKLAEAYGSTLKDFDYYKNSPKTPVVIEKIELVKSGG